VLDLAWHDLRLFSASFHADISSTPSHNFLGSQKLKNCGSIFDTGRIWYALVSKRSNI